MTAKLIIVTGNLGQKKRYGKSLKTKLLKNWRIKGIHHGSSNEFIEEYV